MTVQPAKPGILKIKAYIIDEEPEDFPPPHLLLNSNESVFGPGPEVITAVRDAAGHLERYFENVDQALAPEIGRFFDLDASRITVGNGSDDLLARLARIYLGPGTEMLRSENGYPKAPNYAFANDAEVVSVPDENFKPSVANLIDGITDRTRMIYLANPENPAGTYLNSAEVRALHADMPENALMVLDCAYEEFIDDPDHDSAAALIDSAENVVMSRTFSKIFGLAGARMGWMYGAADIIDNVRRVSTALPLSGTSMAAALTALASREHFDTIFEANRSGRLWLSETLAGMGLNVVPSQVNFILVEFPNPERSAVEADRYLRLRGIAVRRFGGAYQDYLRITIGRRAELEEVAETFRSFLESNQP